MKNFKFYFLIVLCLFLFVSQAAGKAKGKIAYVSDQMGSYDIWIMDEDGSNKTRLTFDDSAAEGWPKFSPDGSKIAYGYYPDGEAWLMMMNVDGSDKIVVKSYEGGYFYLYQWSELDWLYLAANSRPGCFMDDLRRVRPDGSGDEILLNETATHGAGQSPDGKRVMYVKSVYCWTPYNEMHVMDFDGSNDRVIMANDGQAEFWPSYANTSNHQVVFTQADSANGYRSPGNLYIMNDDGTGKTRITNANSNETFATPVFSADDTKIICQHHENEIYNIVSMDRDGQNIVFLTNSSWRDMAPDLWQPGCSFGPEEQPLVFLRGKGKPVLEEAEWESCGGSGTIKVNCQSVSSANIYLNGELLFNPSQFNPQVTQLEKGIELAEGLNILQVQIAGKPGSRLSIEFLTE